MQAPARAWGPSWDGAPAWVAFAEYALYSQEWLRAALTHWELTKWLVPLLRLFFLFLSPLLIPPSLPLPPFLSSYFFLFFFLFEFALLYFLFSFIFSFFLSLLQTL